MALSYATYSEFIGFYNPKGFSVDDITNNWLPHGSLVVNERLAGSFTIPFSSNNETAKDLSIHFAYLGILNRSRNTTDSDELRTYLDDRIASIVSSGNPMITTSGDAIYSNNPGSPKFTAWSNTENYKNTFDVRCAEDQRIDPDYLDDLWDEDLDGR